eukprot:12405-Eustigmatos_ZCMA.PRE.1
MDLRQELGCSCRYMQDVDRVSGALEAVQSAVVDWWRMQMMLARGRVRAAIEEALSVKTT